MGGDPAKQGIAFAREFSANSLPVLGFRREAVKRTPRTSLNEELKIEADFSTFALQGRPCAKRRDIAVRFTPAPAACSRTWTDVGELRRAPRQQPISVC